ncbi:hypothetical protein J0A71_08g18560 [Encephalitozoon cuniculi]|nr:hypothetical protein J0A71_08g18560 [Encephalitozoon cuniculi]
MDKVLLDVIQMLGMAGLGRKWKECGWVELTRHVARLERRWMGRKKDADGVGVSIEGSRLCVCKVPGYHLFVKSLEGAWLGNQEKWLPKMSRHS